MRRARPPAALALALVVATLGAPAAALDIGSLAPDFTVRTLDGRQISLGEVERSHRAVVVLFLSTICPYSNYYNDLIRDMAAEFATKDVLFLGVNSGRIETAEEARTHARDHGHTFPIVKDPEGRVAELFGARRTPEVFVLDQEGRLRYRGRVALEDRFSRLEKRPRRAPRGAAGQARRDQSLRLRDPRG